MKRLQLRVATTTVLALAAVAVASAQETGKGGVQDPKAAEAATKMEQEWVGAFVRRDTAYLEGFLAEDYAFTYPDGTVVDKGREIENVKSGYVALAEIKLSELKARTYGDTAVITGRSTLKGKFDGRDVGGEYRFTDVFVKRGDRWQCVAGQLTRIAGP
jgi:ketosteroid isomerase-like protein